MEAKHRFSDAAGSSAADQTAADRMTLFQLQCCSQCKVIKARDSVCVCTHTSSGSCSDAGCLEGNCLLQARVD